ncbi:RF-1 domain-domain-containing protein [Catenaria anguillulae PL171]|uniref:RF-1 domain-domain-containing protein n=1 Tax=Catenaria anguillulae PL171 TaxID=765915 RepID=A0A1Y2HNQ2_9FUNG|nr:RF-1 domain-domain-containing protein [Catenaria anguillulae PL171]
MNALVRPFQTLALATFRNVSRPCPAAQRKLAVAPISVPLRSSPCLASTRPARPFATAPLAPLSPSPSDAQTPSRPAADIESSSPEAPKKPVPIDLNEDDLDEKFIRGGGNGGQKVNKTSNCVVLTHRPTGIQVRCHETRSLSDNRRIARKLLKQRLDDQINGPLSKRALKEAEERRKKLKRQQKNKKGPSASGGKKSKGVQEVGGASAKADKDAFDQ